VKQRVGVSSIGRTTGPLTPSVQPEDPVAASSVVVAHKGTLDDTDEPVVSRSMGPLAMAQMEMARLPTLLIMLEWRSTW